MTYQPADMVTHNYGLSPKAWDLLQKSYAEHLVKNPTCEICHRNSSVRITPLGKIKASCLDCIQFQRQEMIDEHNRRKKEYEEEYEKEQAMWESQ